MPFTAQPSRRIARLGAAGLCAASIILATATPAAAGTIKTSFAFQYRLEGKTMWTQKPGKTVYTITSCSANTIGMPQSTGEMHVTLVRSQWGPDTHMSGLTLRCREGQQVTFDAPVEGTYYLILTKLDDGKLYKGTATISYPS